MKTEFRCEKCNRLLFIRKWAPSVPLIYKAVSSFTQLFESAIEIKCPKCKTMNLIAPKDDPQVQITQRSNTICISGGTAKYPANLSWYSDMSNMKSQLKGSVIIGENTK